MAVLGHIWGKDCFFCFVFYPLGSNVWLLGSLLRLFALADQERLPVAWFCSWERSCHLFSFRTSFSFDWHLFSQNGLALDSFCITEKQNKGCLWLSPSWVRQSTSKCSQKLGPSFACSSFWEGFLFVWSKTPTTFKTGLTLLSQTELLGWDSHKVKFQMDLEVSAQTKYPEAFKTSGNNNNNKSFDETTRTSLEDSTHP